MNLRKIIIIIAIGIAALGFAILVFNSKIIVDYIPETEISDDDLRKTIVTLYFKKSDSDELEKESRLIDSKELLLDPYTKLIEMLIEGPQNENHERIIPETTKINKVEMIDDCLKIDFSNEIISDQEKYKFIKCSLEKTLTELNEVNEINISVEGKIIE